MDDCDGSIPVARIKEEKQAVQVEREELLANFEQHQQLEKQQQEEKRKVQPMAHCFFPVREEGARCKLEPLLCCNVSWVDLSQGKTLG